MDNYISENLAELGVKFGGQGGGERSAVGSLWVYDAPNPIRKWIGFEQVAVLRVGSNWDVSGSARRVEPLPERLENFFVVLDGQANTVQINIAHLTFRFAINDPRVRIVNSQPTGELLIRFLNSVVNTTGSANMRDSSYLMITD